MAQNVTIIADTAESQFLTFDRWFWQERQAIDLLDAIDLIEDQEQKDRLKNLYYFMSNINAGLIDHGCIMIVHQD